MNLRNLGMEPGDELYFYVQAIDNKTPKPHLARSETYFISLQDTSALANTLDASLGADVMPDYFRSQRQIIIDTEKLLAQKSKITRKVFNERSNALAHDQKVLRLRYGEFLGEEFESGIGPSSAVSGESANDIQKKFGHDHDGDDDRHLDNSDGHVDNNKPTDGQKENALEEFVHAHDGEEEATFFVQSIKAKLKAAISIMWDAELHLRLFEPKTSLPFQYKALKLLKEISQESRIYVHRTGFDPPPLKEESRLIGDLSEIQNSKYESRTSNKNISGGVGLALSLIDQFIASDSIWNDRDTENIFTKAGQELAVLELKQPGGYLKALSGLKMLVEQQDNSIIDHKTLVELRAALWNALPRSIEGPNVKSAMMHDLDQQFLKNLERLQQNP
jgi:hypothetical protein